MITLGTAKAALDQFVRYVAMELAPHGITANLVAPATVEGTRLTEQDRRTQPQLAVNYIASFLGRLTRDEVQRYYERYIGPYFTSDGRVDKNVAKHAVDAVDAELGVATAFVDQIYQP